MPEVIAGHGPRPAPHRVLPADAVRGDRRSDVSGRHVLGKRRVRRLGAEHFRPGGGRGRPALPAHRRFAGPPGRRRCELVCHRGEALPEPHGRAVNDPRAPIVPELFAERCVGGDGDARVALHAGRVRLLVDQRAEVPDGAGQLPGRVERRLGLWPAAQSEPDLVEQLHSVIGQRVNSLPGIRTVSRDSNETPVEAGMATRSSCCRSRPEGQGSDRRRHRPVGPRAGARRCRDGSSPRRGTRRGRGRGKGRLRRETSTGRRGTWKTPACRRFSGSVDRRRGDAYGPALGKPSASRRNPLGRAVARPPNRTSARNGHCHPIGGICGHSDDRIRRSDSAAGTQVHVAT